MHLNKTRLSSLLIRAAACGVSGAQCFAHHALSSNRGIWSASQLETVGSRRLSCNHNETTADDCKHGLHNSCEWASALLPCVGVERARAQCQSLPYLDTPRHTLLNCSEAY